MYQLATMMSVGIPYCGLDEGPQFLFPSHSH
jgi:hypothetical protein